MSGNRGGGDGILVLVIGVSKWLPITEVSWWLQKTDILVVFVDEMSVSLPC